MGRGDHDHLSLLGPKFLNFLFEKKEKNTDSFEIKVSCENKLNK
jgi:hypothetical protein